jgi:hypothetical protein
MTTTLIYIGSHLTLAAAVSAVGYLVGLSAVPALGLAMVVAWLFDEMLRSLANEWGRR